LMPLQEVVPVFSINLYPLYSLGLWLAVITTPAAAFKCLTVKESSGVGLNSSKRNAFMPFPAKTLAASKANSGICNGNHKQLLFPVLQSKTLYIIRKSLGSFSDGVNIDSVGPGTDNSPKSAGTNSKSL